MGVYIKDMEMPKDGRILIVFPSGRVLEVSADETQDIFEEAQAFPVPPHGRLIDADEFLKRAIGTKCFRGDYALMLEELVGESVTIIPAEESET